MRRHDLIYRNSLRPGLILNLILVGLLLAVFGAAHCWLAMRHHAMGKEITAMESEIGQIEKEIRKLETVDLPQRLTNTALAKSIEKSGLRLIRKDEYISVNLKQKPAPLSADASP